MHAYYFSETFCEHMKHLYHSFITTSRMGEAAGVFTLKAQFIHLGNILGVDESHAEELSDSFVI